ncbi:ap-4 complex subunit sigma-1 [Anaeramoeba ignava]|uniref:AP complex subunit sigma n=1 Tax=Anaeramoeba ignava TaxID=1746090 RepID=A0A9Q0LHH9_ANAIG|nr:ap-4 complex subunit sigma-1 [Anaeramoeba ignava]|eukprot:Anaeramoba_ignava/a610948_21.p1 GENE.a610948_21~~a610948_21.p1  ORF type:complete len:145 (-),score=33.83 a610948_21:10-444(-)
MILFFLIVNKLGQTRLAQYYSEQFSQEHRIALENEVTRSCLARKETDCSFFEFRELKIIYRRYASLFFIAAVDDDENEMGIYELIHCLVEAYDKHFKNVCELDIMYNLDKAYMILDEMILNGVIVETNRANVLQNISKFDSFVK